MSQSKLVLMPSIFEGFGLVALEAMALGKPVICSGVGGLSDIVNDSCGYICKTDAEYDDSIKALLNDNHVYASKSAGAIAQAKAFDNLEEYLKNIKDIYTSTRFC
jgi:glycosyltransferase involved in cell wall biosynthesis